MTRNGGKGPEGRKPFEIVELKDERGWGGFLDLWCGTRQTTNALKSAIEVARARGCRTVVIENGYADLDQASEAEFWSREFPVPHTNVHRLHFFASNFDEDDFPMRQQAGYLGYAIVSQPLGRLIRALLRPPPCMPESTALGYESGLRVSACSHCDEPARPDGEGTVTVAQETVELFGVDYPLVGVPYCGQEAWHLQCAHAVAWACLYTGHLLGRATRSTLKEVVDAGTTHVDVQRAVSASGTNLFQLQQTFSSRGMPALAYNVRDLRADKRMELTGFRRSSATSENDQRVFGVVCNYLNSGYPVVAATDDHALTVIGWRRAGDDDGPIELLVSDIDDVYDVVRSPSEHRGGWKHLMIPLPPTVVLSGEAVQHEVHKHFTNLGAYVAETFAMPPKELTPAVAALEKLFASGELSLRLQLKRRQQFKSAAVAGESLRGSEVIRALAVLRLPDWVWAAEVQHRPARKDGKASVLAEFVFDTTSPDYAPHQCAVAIGRVAWCNWPYDERAMPSPKPIVSQGGDDRDVFAWESQINSRSPLLARRSKDLQQASERHAA